MSCYDESVGIYKQGTDVSLWVSANLALHRWDDKTWRISEFESGRYILRDIIKRDDAIQYMIKLRQLVRKWSENIAGMDEVKQKVKELQREIDNENKKKRARV